ncbi:hypothetical protein BGX38DRAFT_179183 [Terfezia claveryi]|nr:hypothetical protein BGX38DRAFT_179183 [Terfezia claveryi]
MSSTTSTRSTSPSDEAAETNSPSYQVFTRGRTRRKMLRGEEKKEEKLNRQQKKKDIPGDAAPATRSPSRPAELAAAGTTKKKRGRFRKPKSSTFSVSTKKPQIFLFEDTITALIPRKKVFQEIIDLTGFNGMGKALKKRRKDTYVPGLLPDGNKEHEVNKEWEEWVKTEFVKLGYPREFTPGPMLDLQTCWSCSPSSSQAMRKGSQARSNSQDPQGSNRAESPSSDESSTSSIEFIVPAGHCTWGSKTQVSRTSGEEKGKGPRPAKRITGPGQQDTAHIIEQDTAHTLEQDTAHTLEQAQLLEVQRLKQIELVSMIRNTIKVTQSVKDNAIAHDNANRKALLARASQEPQEGHNTKHWERTREEMKEKGLFPTGPPEPPLWTKYVAPENAKNTDPNNWGTLNPEELALDPMFAEKIGKILDKFPEVRKWRGVLPPYPDPENYLTLQGAEYVIPNLDELPKKVLLDYVEFVQQGDVRLNGPLSMKVGYDSELLLLYMEVWNRRCALRESALWSMGIATTVGWAGGLLKVESVEDVKRLYPNLAPETVKWCALLVKGFCRMPLVVGLKQDVWHNPRYDNPEDSSTWPSFLNPKRTCVILGSTRRDSGSSDMGTVVKGRSRSVTLSFSGATRKNSDSADMLTIDEGSPPPPITTISTTPIVLRPRSFYRW